MGFPYNHSRKGEGPVTPSPIYIILFELLQHNNYYTFQQQKIKDNCLSSKAENDSGRVTYTKNHEPYTDVYSPDMT